jgi:hypothetical protein
MHIDGKQKIDAGSGRARRIRDRQQTGGPRGTARSLRACAQIGRDGEASCLHEGLRFECSGEDAGRFRAGFRPDIGIAIVPLPGRNPSGAFTFRCWLGWAARLAFHNCGDTAHYGCQFLHGARKRGPSRCPVCDRTRCLIQALAPLRLGQMDRRQRLSG